MGLENIWFTSDLHLGHNDISKHRKFDSDEEHDETVIELLNSRVKKRDKLFILGDVAMKNSSLQILSRINGIKELIIGNHDTYATTEYLKYFTKVHGFRQYRGLWLSHCPIHPQEMHRCRANIHGHIHYGTDSPPLDLPYINVNLDFNRMRPVNMEDIMEMVNG